MCCEVVGEAVQTGRPTASRSSLRICIYAGHSALDGRRSIVDANPLMFSRVLWPVFISFISVFVLACGRIGYDEQSRPLLSVELVTGLVPGPEFTVVETTVLDRESDGRERVVDHAEASARFGIDYVSGHRVSSFRLYRGEHVVRVRLLSEHGQILVEQRASILLRSDYVLRIHITRDCVGVECPAPAGAADATGCLNGRCVDPRCSEETPEFCPEITFCNDATECRATSSCAQMSCDEGVCTPSAIAGTCDDHEWCNPDLGAGCQPFVPETVGSVCGTICEVDGAPCQAGFYNCADPTHIFCDPLFNRVAGTQCGAASFCDVGGECLSCPQGDSCTIGCSRGHIECASGVASCELSIPVDSAPPATPCLDVGTCIDGMPCTTNGACDADGFCDTSAGGAPGVIIAPLLGLTTTEAGGTATVSVRLASIPSANVQVSATTTDGTEGLITDGSILFFTPENWNGTQTVTITGADDALTDGNQTYAMHVVTSSSDDAYDGLAVDDVPVLNIDNESSGVTVTPTSGISTTEGGGTATFSVILSTMPTDDVVIDVVSDTPTEALASPGTLTFTTSNWDAPQIVTVTGIDDAFADGDQSFVIATAPSVSSDTVYNGIDPDDVSGTNIDDEMSTIVVTPTSGLGTTEAGASVTFSVSLTSNPPTDVVLDISSSDLSEGTVSPASLTFTGANWDSVQTVTVTGVDDFSIDGDVLFNARVEPNPSSDASYRDLPPVLVAITNTDDETAGVLVTPTTGLTTTEAAGTATFSVVLNSSPSSSVFINLSSSDTSEGTVSPAVLTFTGVNWNAPQTVTVTGVNDAAADGNQSYTVLTAAAISADANYNAFNASDVSLVNIDDDSAGIAVTPVSGLTTTENLGTATFTVRLNTMPSSSVVINLTSSDLTEGTVAPASLTFTTGNWATPQTVTITGVNDSIADGTQAYTIVTAPASSSDGNYNTLDASNVSVMNTDNDVAGFLLSGLSGVGHTTESLGTTTFNLRLLTAPTTPTVDVTVTSSDLTEGTVSPAMLTFTPGDWNSPHTVTVTGVDDVLLDGNQPFTVVLGAATSADSSYSGLDPTDVAVVNFDNDTPGFTLTPTSVQVTEVGGTAEFTMVLSAQPSNDVTVNLSASDATEATVSPAAFVFTAADWSMPHTATVTGVDDIVADGNVVSSVVTAPATSADLRFSGANPADVPVTTIDNDVPRLVSGTPSGMAGNGGVSTLPASLSGDGRYVVFTSMASNLVPGDTNATGDVFVRDTVANTIERVSVADDESESNGYSGSASITADGRFVVFTSAATNWTAGAHGDGLVYLRDRQLGTTTLVSAINGTNSIPMQNLYGNRAGAVTPDGRYVIFSSGSSNLLGVGPPSPVGAQIYVRDMLTLATTLESVGTGGVYGNGQALFYATGDTINIMSDDGRYLVFSSDSSNFMVGDTPGSYDLFYRDRTMNITVMVNVTPMGTRSSMGAGGSLGINLTHDGRYIAFVSYATDLVVGHTGTRADVFVRDMMTSTTLLASPSSSGGPANDHCYRVDICESGRYVVFESNASNLVAADTNATSDIFVRDLVANTTRRASLSASGMQLTGGSTSPRITDDCNYVAFVTYAAALAAEDTNGLEDLYIVPRP